MLLKPGVVFEPDKTLREALGVASDIFEEVGYLFIITSLKDREHRTTPRSLHHYGMAVDIRIRHIKSTDDLQRIYTMLVDRLSQRYTVLLEKTHIHIEVKEWN
jgi:hypothetical protein